MKEIDFTIPYSIHGRVAQKLSFEVNALQSRILITIGENEDRRITNVGLLLGLLSLGLSAGDKVVVSAANADEEQADRDLKAFMKLFDEMR